jgi:hypothetical protein
VRRLPEDEAHLLAIVFEEIGAYQYRKNKELESGTEQGGVGSHRQGATTPPYRIGLKEGFEEVFSFGEDDPNDYWHFKEDLAAGNFVD